MVRFHALDSNRAAANADTGYQVTQYIHGPTLTGSGIATSRLLSQEILPDSAGPADRITRSYGVAGSITHKMSQVLSLVDDDSTVLAEYARLGLSTFVQQTSPQPDLRYTLISPTLSIDPATGDIYSGLDRFGRVKDVRWRDISAATDLSRIEYGYDRASNRTWRENPSDPNREHDWLYTYDGLHRLSSAERGQLNSGHTAITNDQFNQCWSLDPTGNWKGFQQDDNADGTADLVQTRTANTVNEITDITNTTGAAWATPTYDANGNSLVQPRPDLGPDASMTGVYDAWNRVVKVLDNDTLDVLLENQFDGRNFRIVAKEYASGILARTRDYYFTDAWQSVEEHVDTSNTPRRQYVWGMRYIDDLVLRDRDLSPSGGLLGERLYFLADANWNTTAVVSDSGDVQERYEYTPYGKLSIFESDYTPRAVSNYAVHYTYTSREWTPNAGLYYFRNRWYDAQLGRFSSRDPIGYLDGPNLYNYVSSNPAFYVDPSGLTAQPGDSVDPCDCVFLPAQWFGCCRAAGGAKATVYRRSDDCCEDGQVVSKVEITICRGKLGGDDSFLPNIGYLSHTYIICPDGKQYGKHPNPDGTGYWWEMGWGPGYVKPETERDPSKAKCRKQKVCPKTAKKMCRSGYPDQSYNVLCVPFVGSNCHSWGEGSSE